jgi:hypothetical protein
MALGPNPHAEGGAMNILWVMVLLCWSTAAVLVASIAFPNLPRLWHRERDDELQGHNG